MRTNCKYVLIFWKMNFQSKVTRHSFSIIVRSEKAEQLHKLNLSHPHTITYIRTKLSLL